MSYLTIPGHDRDALADLRPLFAFDTETVDTDDDAIEFGMSGAQLLGLDDARVILDEMAYDDWAAMQDEFDPTPADCDVAHMAAQG